MKIFTDNYTSCSKVGRHVWYDTDLGFKVRKPIGFKQSVRSFFTSPTKYTAREKSWFRRFLDFIFSWYNKRKEQFK